MSEETVDAARLPVAWIAGIDERDAVQKAREPDARREAGRTAANNGDVIFRIVGHAEQEGKIGAEIWPTSTTPEGRDTTIAASPDHSPRSRSSPIRGASRSWDRSRD